MTQRQRPQRNTRLPRRWQCPNHGAPVVFGCAHCASVAKSLVDVVGHRKARTPALLRVAADLVLRFAAAQAEHALFVPLNQGGANVRRRATRALTSATRLYVSVVPGPPTRKKIAA